MKGAFKMWVVGAGLAPAQGDRKGPALSNAKGSPLQLNLDTPK